MFVIARALWLVCVVALFTSASAAPEQQRSLPSGYAIHGVQPGDFYPDVKEKLGKDWHAQEVASSNESRTVFLQNGRGGHLLLRLSHASGGELVKQVSYFPVNAAFSLELDGRSLLSGIETENSVRHKFRVKPSNSDKIVVRKGPQLILRLNLSRQVLQSATLTL